MRSVPGRGPLSPRRLVLFAFAALLVAEAYLAAVRVPGLVNTTPGRSVSVVETGPTDVRQTFAIGVPNLSGISVLPVATKRDPDGTVRMILEDAGTNPETSGRPLRQESIRASSFVSRRRYEWHFEPIRESAGQKYALRIEAPSGVGLVASRSKSYEFGILEVNEQSVWGELVFDTTAHRATVWWRVLGRVGESQHPVAVGLALVALIIAGHVALLTILLNLWSGRESDPEEHQAS